MEQSRRFLGLIMSIMAAACIGDLELEGDPAGLAADALESGNALSPNALSPNALSPNALSPNALSPNALSPNALSPSALTAIKDPGNAGVLSRELLRYTVSCALNTTQSFSFSWTDAMGVVKGETYWGMLGLATSWISQPLSGSDQEWVSACLAARTNWYGVPVTISSRASHTGLNKSGSQELVDYPLEEGAFWGNLFLASPRVYSCYNQANIAHSRQHARECAAGHLDAAGAVAECGVIHIVGPCDAHCTVVSSVDGYRKICNAFDGSGVSSKVVSVFLQ